MKGEIDVNIFSTDLFEWLAAEMIGDKPISLTVKDVFQDKVAGPRGEQTKVIISFVERPKKLILNKTNARTMAAALGAETDNWRGASVTFGVDNVQVGRNSVPSIRVRTAVPPVKNHPNGNIHPPAQLTEQPGFALDDPDVKQAALKTAQGTLG
jgi:hypothetical protein